MLAAVFGAKGQVVLGALTFVLGLVWWVFIEWRYARQIGDDPLVAAIFRVSMFFGLVACYAIIATGLGYRATERVETAVVENIGEADVTAAEVNVEADA